MAGQKATGTVRPNVPKNTWSPRHSIPTGKPPTSSTMDLRTTVELAFPKKDGFLNKSMS